MDISELGTGTENSNQTNAEAFAPDIITEEEFVRQRKLAYARKYYAENKERLIAEAIARKRANPERVRELANARNAKNREEVRRRDRENYQKNKESRSLRSKAYRAKNPELHREWKRKSSKKHAKKRLEYARIKRATDPQARAAHNIRSRIHSSLKSMGYQKSGKTIHLLGCSFSFFRAYIESKFEPWMTWDNYGKSEGQSWHIDHIRAISKFNLAKPEEQSAAFHYTNCQPLEWFENLSKGNKDITPSTDAHGQSC